MIKGYISIAATLCIAGLVHAETKAAKSSTIISAAQNTRANDQPKRLERVTVNGRYDPLAPTTGQVFMRGLVAPDYLLDRRPDSTRSRTRKFRTRRFRSTRPVRAPRYDSFILTFTAVELGANDAISLQPLSYGQRSFNVRSKPGDRKTPWGFRLPEGSYVLSEVRFIPRREGRVQSDLRRDSLDIIVPRTYCLSQKTIVFDVTAGETGFLGSFIFEEPPGRSRKIKSHIPLAEFAQDTQDIQKQPAFAEAPTELGTVPTFQSSFENVADEVCKTVGAYKVPAWQ